MTIELKKLNMAYGNTVALKDFDLSIEEGEFVAILGPSGGGKSTVLRIIAGLILQDSGDVVINGEVMNNIHPSERNVAMVFQNQALYPHMTVYNNIALNLKMKGVLKDEIDRRVNEVARVVGIGGILSRKPREISGGQAQRVGLARAMIRDPVIYLMDEPTNVATKICSGLSYNSLGVPSWTITPLFSTIIRFAMDIASIWSCVT